MMAADIVRDDEEELASTEQRVAPARSAGGQERDIHWEIKSASVDAEVETPLFGNLSTEDSQEVAIGEDLSMVMNIAVNLTVELGRRRIPIRDLLQLKQGAVLELQTLAGEPLNILINDVLLAKGEVVVVEDKYGIRLTDILTPSERMNKLKQ